MNAWTRLRLARPRFLSLAWVRALILPLCGILAFLLIWHVAAGRIDTPMRCSSSLRRSSTGRPK